MCVYSRDNIYVLQFAALFSKTFLSQPPPPPFKYPRSVPDVLYILPVQFVFPSPVRPSIH